MKVFIMLEILTCIMVKFPVTMVVSQIKEPLKCMGEQSVRILLNTAGEYIIKIQVHSTCTVVQSLIIQQALATMMVAEVCTMKVCSACPVDIFSKTSPLIMVEE